MYSLASHCPQFLWRSFSLSIPQLAGHNKWSKIKQKKGVNDAQKSVIYYKANHDISIAVRMPPTAGESDDPFKNHQLAVALKKAIKQGVPKENIEKAISRVSGRKGNASDNLTYEALAFNSIGLIIECLTDNVNRTLHNIRDILNHHNAHFALVKFMFQQKGCVTVALQPGDDIVEHTEYLIETALEYGAEDFNKVSEEEEEGVYQLLCPPDQLTKVMAPFSPENSTGKAWELQLGELIYAPVEANEGTEEVKGRLTELISELEANKDMLRVWTTLDS